MKLIRVAALGAAMFVGVSATASAQGGGQQASPCDGPPAASAQPPAGGGQGRGGRGGGVAMLLKDITLTAEQKTKCEEIVTKFRAEMQAARSAGGDMSAMRPIQENQTKALREILTADQQKAFDKNVADRAAAMQNRPNPTI